MTIVWDKAIAVKYWVNKEWTSIKENLVVTNLFYCIDLENKLLYIKYDMNWETKIMLATYDYFEITKLDK
jgi:hypothetical protein